MMPLKKLWETVDEKDKQDQGQNQAYDDEEIDDGMEDDEESSSSEDDDDNALPSDPRKQYKRLCLRNLKRNLKRLPHTKLNRDQRRQLLSNYELRFWTLDFDGNNDVRSVKCIASLKGPADEEGGGGANSLNKSVHVYLNYHNRTRAFTMENWTDLKCVVGDLDKLKPKEKLGSKSKSETNSKGKPEIKGNTNPKAVTSTTTTTTTSTAPGRMQTTENTETSTADNQVVSPTTQIPKSSTVAVTTPSTTNVVSTEPSSQTLPPTSSSPMTTANATTGHEAKIYRIIHIEMKRASQFPLYEYSFVGADSFIDGFGLINGGRWQQQVEEPEVQDRKFCLKTDQLKEIRKALFGGAENKEAEDEVGLYDLLMVIYSMVGVPCKRRVDGDIDSISLRENWVEHYSKVVSEYDKEDEEDEHGEEEMEGEEGEEETNKGYETDDPLQLIREQLPDSFVIKTKKDLVKEFKHFFLDYWDIFLMDLILMMMRALVRMMRSR
jgi:hypothetical protein